MENYLLINSAKEGGAERKVSYLLSHLNIARLLLLEKETGYNIDINKVYWISHHKVNTSGFLKTMYVFIYAFKLYLYLKGKRCRIISFLERANYVNIISNLFFRHETIISIECNVELIYSKGLKRLHYFFIRLLYPYADKIICVSEGVKNGLKKIVNIDNTKIIVVANGIDIEELDKMSSEPIEPELAKLFNSDVIVTSGRLIRLKNHKLLISAFNEIKKETDKDVRLLILGDGPMKKELIRFAVKKQLKICDLTIPVSADLTADIFFAGFKQNPFKYLAHSRVFVLTSDMEGFSLAILESLACNLPVISTDCNYGPRELLSSNLLSDMPLMGEMELANYGILSPVNNLGMLKKALLCLLDDEDLHSKYSKASRLRALEFSYDRVLTEFNTLLNEKELF